MKIASDPEATPIPDSAPAVCVVFGADPIEASAMNDGRLQAAGGPKASAATASPDRLPD